MNSRRHFLQHSLAASAVFTILPSGSARTYAANEKLSIAAIGVGGMGGMNLKACSAENIVALCDVDTEYAAATFKEHPQAERFTDHRQMLERRKDIEAVLIATPDHTHAHLAMACIRTGKHVYVQKPLAHSVHEVRVLTEAARQHQVVTQMGNQGHSGEGTRLICEWIWAGAIGQVREVHAWTNRPVWPQSIEMRRPAETPAIPKSLDWEQWIGPAPMRPYHPEYHPAKWRAWCDFGTGSLGDLGCHVLDPIFWAMKLKYPSSVEANISTFWEGFWKQTRPTNECFPRSSIVRYQFPERDGMVPLRLTWYDGGLKPARPAELDPARRMGDNDGGVLFIGDKGTLMTGCYGRSPQLLPRDLAQDFKRPERTLPRIEGGEGGHERDWIRACKGGPAACSHFDYSGPLSEMVLMGNLAVRHPDRMLLWDGDNMQITNDPAANRDVRRQYREGYSL